MPATPRTGLSAACALLVASFVPGCAQPGPFTSRGPLVSGLKASVSQLESEKEELRKELADSKAENHRISDRLLEEEARTGDLTARLDGAKNILRGQGLDAQSASAPVRDELDPDPIRPDLASVSPAGRPQPKPRKAPFAEIRNGSYPDADAPDPDDSASNSSNEALNPRSIRDEDPRWLPVARGLSEPRTAVR